ncbi:cytochrome C oxidase subunit IV family protein [Anaerobacillus sp. MEB173]|uniref:cytochrome C oxidase subunit IV family protein n=1 Tax=Anaerobacillus sp. MEB173 TaxID=3383345 RepID=UPI003F935692
MEQKHTEASEIENKILYKREMKHQLVSFGLMIFLTIIAFMAVVSEVVTATFALPFILILAVIQVLLQLYYFMHLNQKGHTWPSIMIWSGIIIAIPTVASLMLLLGIVKY